MTNHLLSNDKAASNAANNTIYSSMTQKLRKERGQNLDPFISTFVQSIEQSSMTDIGEDVIMMREFKPKPSKPQPPGTSQIFGNLFNLRIPTHDDDETHSYIPKHSVIGPTQCLIYIRKEINFFISMNFKLFIEFFSIKDIRCTTYHNSLRIRTHSNLTIID